MTRSANTGPTVPGWIRDEIARQEAAWPLAGLAAGLGALVLLQGILGAVLWNAQATVVYAAFP